MMKACIGRVLAYVERDYDVSIVFVYKCARIETFA